MNKSLYFVECTANYDVVFDNGLAKSQYGQEHNLIKTIYKKGDIVYFNPNAISNESCVDNEKNPYKHCCNNYGHLPFTRQKKFAKKWQIKRYANRIAELINSAGQFTAVVKEIKLTYIETEV